MNILCALFGHKSNEQVYSGAEYMTIRYVQVDGLNRHHACLFVKCPRCGEQYRAGMLHLPKPGEL
jgi:hypothetical protein